MLSALMLSANFIILWYKTFNMAKRKPSFELYSYGIYSKWERDSKEIPRLLEITDVIKAEPDLEFGYLLKVKGGKGCKLTFRINHPEIHDKNGKPMLPFEGEHYVNSNDWEFFLGDTIWEPVEDKLGSWELITYFEGKVVAHKVLRMV